MEEELLEFEATMSIAGILRSPCRRFLLRDSDRKGYPMLPHEVVNMMLKGVITRGIISGKWDVYKQGDSYSLRFIS